MLKFPRATAVLSLVFTAAAAIATAAPITDLDSGLTIDPANTLFYQQTTASPCVIGGNNCNNPAGFLFTDAAGGGGGTTSDYYSPVPFYTVAQILGVTGGSTSFTMGLDYNEAKGDKGGPQRLMIFEANYYINGSLLSSQIFDVLTNLPTNNNGVGYSDFLLTGFVIPATATHVQFRAKWYNNDGPDRYFILGADPGPVCTENCNQAPEPASLALFGMAAAAAAVVRRRRK